MTNDEMHYTIVFGGAGSVGLSFIEHYLQTNFQDHNDVLSKTTSHEASRKEKIIIADIREPYPLSYQSALKKGLESGLVSYLALDVRNENDFNKLPSNCDLIANFAAVHREPGHDAHEYFETNIRGAENVCAYAETSGCAKVIFTSSISPYGPCEKPTTEKSLTKPNSPYGSSKLAAEKIHETWCMSTSNKKLIIVRPGVLFGPGEGGNVGRMIQAIQRGMFFYCGNKKVVKAGGYLRELANTICWAIDKVEELPDQILLYNFSMAPPRSFEQFAEAIKETLGSTKKIRSLPYPLIFALGLGLTLLLTPLRMQNAFSPMRLRKLTSSNNVLPETLQKLGYKYKYTLTEALADWKSIEPSDWETKDIREIERNSNFVDSLKSL